MSRIPSVEPIVGGASLMVAWQLASRTVVVIGGGSVAAGRVKLALEADAQVTVIAPRLVASLRHRWSDNTINWRPNTWHPDDLHGADLVLSCLDDPGESKEIYRLCKELRIPVNCADHPTLCDFWFTSTHRQGSLQLSMTTKGQGPAVGARLMRELASKLPKHIDATLTAFGTLRRRIRTLDPAPTSSSRRMGFLSHVARVWSWKDLARLDASVITTLTDQYQLGKEAPDGPTREHPVTGQGRIRLVGAGPGDPQWLTVAARDALEQADLVLADRLVPTEILDLVQGELRIARKIPGHAQAAQDQLDAWTLEAAQQGRDIVRLKCGDPFVFGRGGEELAFLQSHGLHAEVIPGVTSAFAAPLAAGIPTTMRGHANRVLVLTATGRHNSTPDTPTFDDATTFVWLMGVRRMRSLFKQLAWEGFPPHWPAAVVERAGHPNQRVFRGTVATLPQISEDAGVIAPATIVVGRVVEALQQAEMSEVSLVAAC
jgi:uroporphyrin-III C-methyltransferase